MLFKKLTKFRRSGGKVVSRSKADNHANADHKDDKIVEHTPTKNNNSHKTDDRLSPATTTGPACSHQGITTRGRGFGDREKQKTTNTTGSIEQQPGQDQQLQNVHLHGRMKELQADMERHEFEMMRLKKRMVSIVNKVQVNNIDSHSSHPSSIGNANGIAAANNSNGIIYTKSLPNGYSRSATTIPAVSSSETGLTASRTASSATPSSEISGAKTPGKTTLLARAEASSQPQQSSVPEWMKQLKQKQQQKKHQQQNGITTRSSGGVVGSASTIANGSWLNSQSTAALSKTKFPTPATTTAKKSSTTNSVTYDSVPVGRTGSNNNKRRSEMVVASNNNGRETKPTMMVTPTRGQSKSKSTTTRSPKKTTPAVAASASSPSSSPAGLLAEIRKGTKLNKVPLSPTTRSSPTTLSPCMNTNEINTASSSKSTPASSSTHAPVPMSELFIKIQKRKQKLEQM